MSGVRRVAPRFPGIEGPWGHLWGGAQALCWGRQQEEWKGVAVFVLKSVTLGPASWSADSGLLHGALTDVNTEDRGTLGSH